MDKRYVKTSVMRIMLCAIIIIGIGQIAQVNSSEILVIIALLNSIVFSAFLPETDLLPLMLCILPANRLLTYNSISAPTIIMLVALVRKWRMLINIPKKIFFPSLLLLIYSAFSLFTYESVFLETIKILVMLFFIYLYIGNDDIYRTYCACTIFCGVGCVITCGIAVIINPVSLIGNSRFSISKSGENVLGIMCAVVTINLVIILLDKIINKRYLIVVLCLILCLIGFLTGSRSFIMALAIGIVGILIMLIFSGQANDVLRIVITLLMVGIGAFLCIMNSDFMRNYWKSLVYRITKLQAGDVSNGRFEIWNQYFTIFRQKPRYLWFGGLNVGTNGIDMVAHNMIIEQIAEYGIIGTLIIVILYMSIFEMIVYKTNSEIHILSYRIIPILSLLCVSFVSHTLLGVPQTTMLFICFFSLLKDLKEG